MENQQKEEAVSMGIDLANGPDKTVKKIMVPKTKTKIKSKPIAPGEWREQTKHEPKTFGNTDQSKCKDNVPDVVMFGGDLFKLLSKASSESEGWMKSTKAYSIGKGCLVQVTTQQRNPDGSYSVAEALSYVPNVYVKNIYEDGTTTGPVTGRVLACSN